MTDPSFIQLIHSIPGKIYYLICIRDLQDKQDSSSLTLALLAQIFRMVLTALYKTSKSERVASREAREISCAEKGTHL